MTPPAGAVQYTVMRLGNASGTLHMHIKDNSLSNDTAAMLDSLLRYRRHLQMRMQLYEPTEHH